MLDKRIRLLYALIVVKKLTGVRLKEEHLKALAEEAKRQDVSVSHLIRVAVVDFLKRLKAETGEKK